MKNKIILYILICATFAQAEVTTILPFKASLKYGDKSTKEKGIINGFYISNGTLNYLTEFAYSHTDIEHKNTATNNLVQDEVTMVYTKFNPNYSLKIGLHTNSTTDVDLQNGNTLILGTTIWKWFGYDKLTFGLDYYTTYYVNGKDLNGTATPIRVHQVSPSLTYFKNIGTFNNTLSIKGNFTKVEGYIIDKTTETTTNETKEDEFEALNSVEVKNTFAYKSLYLELGYFSGKLRTGIRDAGMTVYNSKDIIKQSASAKIGFNIAGTLNTSVGYTATTFDEYGGILDNTKDVTNKAMVATISYSY